MRVDTRISCSGFTMVEVAVSMAVFAVLMTTVFSITVETSSFLGDNDVESSVQLEAHRSFERISEILRKSGRVTIGGVTYPRVINGGTELEFRILADLDGNGYAFNASTGAQEWSGTVYTVRADAAGNLDIYNGGGKVYALGRFIRNLSFQTITENPALNLKEVQVTFEARKATQKANVLVFPVNGSILLRN